MHTSSQHIVYLYVGSGGNDTYVDNRTPYKVAYLQLLHKLLGGTGMLVDYLWLASYLLKHAVTIATT